MRILLDESLPRKLGHELTGHEIQTVQKRGWGGLKNGELLRKASGEFQVLLTGDQNIEYQQNPARLPIAVIVLVAANNRIETLRPLVPRLLEALAAIRPGQLVRVGA
jgi:predicted nuclease of predicted toxin-antitoxin system